MRHFVLVALVGCGFSSHPDGTNDAGADAMIDAPPANASVRITSLKSDATMLRPGLYDFSVKYTVMNDLDVDLSVVRPSLSFSDGTSDRSGLFKWRDYDRREGATAPHAATLAAHTAATFDFKVDAMPWAIPPGPILVNGLVTFVANGTPASATPLDPPLSLPFVTLPPPIVVNFATDEQDGDTNISFREALALAAGHAGLDRIVFDPAVFPSGAPVKTVLSETLGALPAYTTDDLVIDGSGAGFILAVDQNWETPSGRWGFDMSGGTVVMYGIGIEAMAFNYPVDDLSANNCGALGPQTGGAIRATGGTLVLQSVRFDDSAVAERNCYATSVAIDGGAGHRILDNTWVGMATDGVNAKANVVEISGNIMSAAANPARGDDCILLGGTGSDIWIIGNICVDQEFDAINVGGTAGTVHVINNTFVRDGRTGNSAVRRDNARTIEFRNNIFVSNNPSAIQTNNNGTGFDFAGDATENNPLCSPTCPNATIDAASMFDGTLMLVNGGGSTRADLTPKPASPLIDSGVVWIDRNGARPGWFTNAGPERGAIETP